MHWFASLDTANNWPLVIPEEIIAFAAKPRDRMMLITDAMPPAARGEVRLPKVFSSHMVMQQDKPLIVWGWAQPNEKVTVELSGASQEAQANERGEWKGVLPAMKAGGPYTLTVSGSSKVQFEDVMIGEVWLCSGQSNMEMGVGVS